ncbi:rod shape-determining protein RodA [Thermodesulfovibrionales bacterium]|nr:rod shape-determining protein RodA [Thermodesulfovibrionales bacterium]
MLKIDEKLIKNFDWLTLAIVIILSVVGIMTIYSATRPPIDILVHSEFYLKQVLWLAIGIIALFIVVLFDYRLLQRYSYLIFGLGLVLLVSVSFAGDERMGAQRWLSIGPISFQPSELLRVFFIIGVSSYLIHISQYLKEKISIKSVLIFAILPAIFVILPVALLIKQPDLGTAILLASLFVILLVFKGIISKKAIAFTLIVGFISIPFLGHILWEGLRDHQRNRLIVFLNPAIDPTGIGWQVNQSKIAIGSGGFSGKGFLEGTQGPLRFLPERHTDFIFPVFAEEWGFIGSIVLLSLFLVLFLRGLDTAVKARDNFGRLVAFGITAMFFIYFCVNIGMTVGLMPVVGIPLPFISYGGTALLSNFIAAGILINIRARRFEFFYPPQNRT